MADEDTQQQLVEAQVEIARLRQQIGETHVLTGTGSPEAFYAAGGVGDVVLHPETGEPLLNPVSGYPIVQEHPRVAAEAYVASAERVLAEAEAAIEPARAALEAARAELANADARYAEIVAHLVTQQGQNGDEG